MMPRIAPMCKVARRCILGRITPLRARAFLNSVADAAREGTRYAIVHGQKSGSVATTATVNTYVQSRSSLKPITVTTTWPTTKEAGEMVAVTVTYNYKRVGLIIPNKTLSSTSKMVIVY